MKITAIPTNKVTGLIYRNPAPHVVSRHAFFPWVIYMENGELLSSFVIAEAFEAANSDTYLSKSKDGGNTWSNPIPLLPPSEKIQQSNCARITYLGNGEVVAFVVRSDRRLHPTEGLANPDNLGFVPTDLLLVRSHDFGNTWGSPENIKAPVVGPSFEACSPIVTLMDGRWIWPTSTWRGWDGYSPNGMKMIAFVSYDQGKTWPEYLNIMDGRSEQVIYWEGKIIELDDNRLISTAWAYDEKNKEDRPNHYSVSKDGGETWTSPTSTGIHGQTLALAKIHDNQLITVYRRMDKQGLWASIAHLEDEKWINDGESCLWGGVEGQENGHGNNMVKIFNELRFGAPCINGIAKGSYFICFWCYEQLVSNIRWIKINL